MLGMVENGLNPRSQKAEEASLVMSQDSQSYIKTKSQNRTEQNKIKQQNQPHPKLYLKKSKQKQTTATLSQLIPNRASSNSLTGTERRPCSASIQTVKI